jgi:hypothetical protein
MGGAVDAAIEVSGAEDSGVKNPGKKSVAGCYFFILRAFEWWKLKLNDLSLP